MGGVVHGLQAGGGHVGVHLGGLEPGVPQQFLHGTKVRAVIQQVRGEAVPELVGREVGIEAGGGKIPLETPLNLAGHHGLGRAWRGEEGRARRIARVPGSAAASAGWVKSGAAPPNWTSGGGGGLDGAVVAPGS